VGERQSGARARRDLLSNLGASRFGRDDRQAIPLTYFLDAYRAHYGFESEFAAPIATGLLLSAVYAALAHWAFLAAIQRARRTGLLLKMSE